MRAEEKLRRSHADPAPGTESEAQPLLPPDAARETRRATSDPGALSYQRGFPRPLSPPPNPPPLERGLSCASFTLSERPSRSLPSSSAIAALASASDPIVTNANPRGRPVSRSLGMATYLTVRASPLNAMRSDSSVWPQLRF